MSGFDAGSVAWTAGMDSPPGVVGDLDSAMDQLTAELDALENLIEPVLHPPSPEPSQAATLEVAEWQSPLRDRADRVRRIARRVHGLAARVDL